MRVVAHVASGLDALHAGGIVHRDVKPSNVIIDEAGSAYLTDFGLAKGRAYTVLTKPMVMGTLDYLAPEMLRGSEATGASDIYALGCVTFECTAGRAPFADTSMFDLASAHLNLEPPDPCADRSDAPRALVGDPAGSRRSRTSAPDRDRVRAPDLVRRGRRDPSPPMPAPPPRALVGPRGHPVSERAGAAARRSNASRSHLSCRSIRSVRSSSPSRSASLRARFHSSSARARAST